MSWFSNHLLVRPKVGGDWDDVELKEALRSGRLYGTFDVMGYPADFDYYALEGGTTREMGEEASLAAGVTLHITMPRLQDLSTEAEPPVLSARVLRATEDGSWKVVGEGDGDLDITLEEPGAYRAEVRIEPRHLAYYLNDYVELATTDFPWIYSNAIYVVD